VPTSPTDQYVPTVRSGAWLFVAGHDPERDGRLVYRGRVGESVRVRDTGAALRLATANALASARDAAGSLERLRCVVLTAYVSTATPEGLDPDFLSESLALLAVTLPAGGQPAVWLRPAQGLAAGMPVEVELMLEATRRRTRPPRAVSRLRTGARASARRPRRSGARTS
jgi:enamine deaminase RidA (YjgF/YER057c/UK114 family)